MFDVISYLESQGIKKIKIMGGGSKIQACCPFHNDTVPSLSIDKDRLLWYCFGCEQGGTFISFISKIENISYSAAKRKLDGINFNIRECSSYKITEPSTNNMYEIFKKGEGTFIPKFLSDRNITEEDMFKFNIRIMLDDIRIKSDRASFSLFGWIIFGIYDWSNQFIGITARKISYKDKIFWQPRLINKFFWGEWLYKGETAILVEGIFDAIFLAKHGLPAIALNGTNLTDAKINRMIQKNIKEVYIFLDPDAEKKAIIMRDRLNLIGFRAFTIVANSDPDELNEIQIQNLKNLLLDKNRKKDLTKI